MPPVTSEPKGCKLQGDRRDPTRSGQAGQRGNFCLGQKNILHSCNILLIVLLNKATQLTRG